MLSSAGSVHLHVLYSRLLSWVEIFCEKLKEAPRIKFHAFKIL